MADNYVSKVSKLWEYSSRSESPLLGLDLFLRTMETREDFPYRLRKRVSDYTTKMMELTKQLTDIERKHPDNIYTTEGKNLVKSLHGMSGYIKKLVGDLKHYREQRQDTWDDDLNNEIKRLEYAMPYVEGMMKLSDEIYKAPVLDKPMMSMPSMPSMKMPSMPTMKSDAVIVAALVIIASMG
ncbi:MAG: hypothetical protein ACYTFW_20195, partial [Planctomycetota bacterium]